MQPHFPRVKNRGLWSKNIEVRKKKKSFFCIFSLRRYGSDIVYANRNFLMSREFLAWLNNFPVTLWSLRNYSILIMNIGIKKYLKPTF